MLKWSGGHHAKKTINKIVKEHAKTHAIFQSTDGFWYTRLPVQKGGRKTILRKRKTKKDLEDLIVEHYHRQEVGVTVGELFATHQARLFDAGDISAATLDRNDRDFRRFFDRGRLVSDFDADKLARYLSTTRGRLHLTSSGYRALCHTARVIFTEARKQGLISWRIDDVIEAARPGKNAFRREAHKETPAFSEAEAEKLLRMCMDSPDVKNLGIILLFLSGLRVGEVVTLTQDDASEEALVIRRTETTYTDGDGTHTEVLPRPKTADGERIVPLPASASWIISKLKAQPAPWLLYEHGHRVTAGYLRKRLYRLCDAAGIPRRGLHAIRRTYASALLDAGLPEKCITDTMGHSTISITQDRYGRQIRTLDERRLLLVGVPLLDMVSEKEEKK